MKEIIKRVLEALGIDAFLGKLVGYAMTYNSTHYPEVCEYNNNLLALSSREALLRQIEDKGTGVRISGRITVIYPKGLKIENNVHIGEGCYLFCRGGLIIGENSHLSRNIAIYTGSHRYQGHALPYDSFYDDKSVRIGRNVWIGMNVNIVPGVTIGEGSVLGMGVTVTKDVPPFSVVGTQPERIIKERDRKHYARLDEKGLWSGASGRLLNSEEKGKFRKTASALKSRLFFVLGTGRSGSTTISHALSQHPEVVCKHEPKLELVKLSTQYAHGEIEKSGAKQALSRLYSELRTYPNLVYGESDQKLSNMIELLHEELPEAKFIWLIRNPVDTVNSMYSRGWFSDEEVIVEEGFDPAASKLFRGIFSQYRIQGDRAGVYSQEEWRSMSAFARNCWYWSYWNRLIESQLSLIPSSQYIRVRLEELDQKIEDVLSFLGISSRSDIRVGVTNRAFSDYQLKRQENWSDDMQIDFERICRKEFDRWYPDDANQLQ